MHNLQAIQQHLVAAGFQMSLPHEGVACIELSLDNGSRHQSIFLSELDDDDGRPYLRVSSAVAPIAGLDAHRALVFNWQSRVGYLAIGDMGGERYLQLCENRPFDGLDGAEAHRLVLEIGGLADHMEQSLSGERDLL
ncbi:hypothetical protein [Lysobacter sp. A289]